jgi:hypothetical protein
MPLRVIKEKGKVELLVDYLEGIYTVLKLIVARSISFIVRILKALQDSDWLTHVTKNHASKYVMKVSPG